MLGYLFSELLMINISNSDYYNIVSIEVICMEPSNVVFFDIEHIISVTFDRLTHHVLSVDIEMNIFNGGFQELWRIVLMLLGNFFFD